MEKWKINMTYINSTPKQDGFRMPAEHEKHDEIWLGWPERTDTWQWGAKPAQKAFAEVANTISRYTKVSVAVSAHQFDNARSQLDTSVRLIEMSSNDSWLRDTGPTYVVNDHGQRRAIDWQFNAWGGLSDGLYFPWDLDNAIASKIANIYRDDVYKAPLILEGGSIHSDGEGTIYTTKECLLHPSRNPNLTQNDIENYLKEYLGAEKIIWVENGLFADDDTNGHVDNLMHVAAPAEIILSWTDDLNDPQYAISAAALATLENQEDARGRKIKVHKLTLPAPLTITKEEGEGFDYSEGMHREAGTRLAASYANFLITNNLIIFPKLSEQSDNQAKSQLEAIFPKHDVIGVDARNILLGGGNIHCITQQIPTALGA
jgi:agmatine deiminase